MKLADGKPTKDRCLVRVTAVQPDVPRMCCRGSDLAPEARECARNGLPVAEETFFEI